MYISQTNSTNTLLRDAYPDAPHLFTIRTDYQSAGRGQSGNGWESEAGQNLLFSTLLRPDHMPAARQFDLSMAVALALHRTIKGEMSIVNFQLSTIKWPNDLYYGDLKLAGILIENILQGACIERSIVGVGLNVNQRTFASAPNPTSLSLITGQRYDLDALLERFLAELATTLTLPHEELKQAYLSVLYRREGFYPYQEREVSVLPTNNISPAEAERQAKPVFMAEIADVTDFGELILRTRDGENRTYHYKQIRYVL